MYHVSQRNRYEFDGWSYNNISSDSASTLIEAKKVATSMRNNSLLQRNHEIKIYDDVNNVIYTQANRRIYESI